MSLTLPPTAVGPRPEARPEVEGAGAALEWSFNPWRQATPRAVLGTVAFVLAAVSIATLRLPPLAAAVLLVVFTSDFLQVVFPSRCRVDEQGVARRLLFWERRPWDRIRVARVGQQGLFVSPSVRPAALASFRGMLLPIPTAAPAALVNELRRRLTLHGL